MNSTKDLIDGYLFGEMGDVERTKFEEMLLADEDLFVEVQEVENEAVDRYVRDEMSGAELVSFEKSLARVPSRRSKVSNATALRRFALESRLDGRARGRSGLLERLTVIFRQPYSAYAAACALLIVAAASLLLLIDNRRKTALINELQANAALYGSANARESDLQNRIDQEVAVSGDLTSDLEYERDKRRKLETEIASLRRDRGIPPAAQTPNQTRSSVAAITLDPINVTGREVPTIKLEGAEESVSMVLLLPGETDADIRVNVLLNGQPLADGLRVRVNGSRKSISVAVPTAKLGSGQNKLTVMAGTKKLGEYEVRPGR